MRSLVARATQQTFLHISETIPILLMHLVECIVLLKYVSAIIKSCWHGGIYLVLNDVDIGGT